MSANGLGDQLDDAVAKVAMWASSGAMALTGSPEEPLGPPTRLVGAVTRLGRRFGLDEIDALALLGERAALMGLWRRGAVSCGGSCRLLPTQHDGWLAVSLPRAEDFDLVPAWLELSGDLPNSAPATWSAVTTCVAEGDSGKLVDRARLLGLAVSRLGEVAPTQSQSITEIPLGDAPGREGGTDLLVVDLSALWAGPLCGGLLASTGASVVKVESTTRPDGARRGPAAFFDVLNGMKRSVALDFAQAEDLRLLQQIVQRADVVIEASRPRALAQLGIDAATIVRSGGPQVWISITGYGRSNSGADRIAFGDDAAVGGGLVAWARPDATPAFCADAIGDPLTGLTAASACVDALSRGGRWLLDVSMAAVCASMTGPTLPVREDVAIAEPRARRAARPAPELGADTAAVLAELEREP